MLPGAERAGLVSCSSASEKPLLVDALASNVEKNIQSTKYSFRCRGDLLLRARQIAARDLGLATNDAEGKSETRRKDLTHQWQVDTR